LVGLVLIRVVAEEVEAEVALAGLVRRDRVGGCRGAGGRRQRGENRRRGRGCRRDRGRGLAERRELLRHQGGHLVDHLLGEGELSVDGRLQVAAARVDRRGDHGRGGRSLGPGGGVHGWRGCARGRLRWGGGRWLSILGGLP